MQKRVLSERQRRDGIGVCENVGCYGHSDGIIWLAVPAYISQRQQHVLSAKPPPGGAKEGVYLVQEGSSSSCSALALSIRLKRKAVRRKA